MFFLWYGEKKQVNTLKIQHETRVVTCRMEIETNRKTKKHQNNQRHAHPQRDLRFTVQKTAKQKPTQIDLPLNTVV
jgi:uncharacterized membrane protein